MSGYVRQATANIQSGKVIYAEDINAELNAISAAFSGSTGHLHDGSTGNGPKIELSNSVVGTLPLANGGTGATNATGARTNIGAHNATNLTTGTLPAARLSGNYSFGSLTLSGNLNTDGSVRVGGNLRVGEAFIRWEEDTLYIAPRTGDASGRQVIIRPRGYGNDTSQIVFSSNGYIEIPNGGVTASGTFTGNGSGLTNLNASRVTTGTLPAARLPNHSADLLTSGTLPSGRLSGNYSFGSLTLSGNLNLTSGRIAGDAAFIETNPGGWTVRTNNNSSNYILSVQSGGGAERFKVVHGAPLLQGDSTGWSVNGAFTATSISGTLSGNGSGITNINASNISSGTLNDGRIPNLNASKVTAGTFHVDRIPALPASKVTSGTFAVDRIPSLDASILGSGTVPAARLSGNYSFGSLTLSGSLTTGGDIWVDSNNINIQSDSNKNLRYRDSTGTIHGLVSLDQSDGRLFLRVHDASGSPVHLLALERNGRATFTGTIYGNGEGLTNLNASNISSGTLPAARLPNHSAALLTSGTLPAGRLSGDYSFGSLTLSGDITAGSLNINSNASVAAVVSRTNNTANANIQFQTTSGSVYAGQGASNTFSVGGSSDLRTDTWMAVTSSSASFSGTISGNGSGITNLNASNLSSGTLPSARLSGNYSFNNLTLSGGLSTNAIRVGVDSFHVISRNTTNSWLELEGGNGGGSSSRILLYGPDNSGGRGDLRHNDTVRLRWDGSTVQADNGAGGLRPVATVYTGTDADYTDFPIGHTILIRGARGTRNSTVTPRIDGSQSDYAEDGSGTSLSGTWRRRGGGPSDLVMAQRVA